MACPYTRSRNTGSASIGRQICACFHYHHGLITHTSARCINISALLFHARQLSLALGLNLLGCNKSDIHILCNRGFFPNHRHDLCQVVSVLPEHFAYILLCGANDTGFVALLYRHKHGTMNADLCPILNVLRCHSDLIFLVHMYSRFLQNAVRSYICRCQMTRLTVCNDGNVLHAGKACR